jgi:ATP-dependent exoDNAse (exonuclease V) beta subunit
MLQEKYPHPRDGDIDMDVPTHVYTIKGETDYISCTTFIKSFFGKFDADSVIDSMMSKASWSQNKLYGMTKEEIKTMWTENGAKAAEYGTKMHAVIEDHYNGIISPVDEVEYKYFNDFFRDHQHLVPFRTEMKVYDEDIKVCGTIDMLFLNPDDGTLSIYDWKFSKEIQHEAFGRKKGKAPLDHLDDCNVMHYSMQLNLYREILQRKYGYKVKDMHLVFMHRLLSDSYMKLEVEVMQSEIDALYATRQMR